MEYFIFIAKLQKLGIDYMSFKPSLHESKLLELKDDDFIEVAKELEAQSRVDNARKKLNNQRDKELQHFVIDDIFINKEILYDMSVEANTTADDENIKWIDINNQIIELTKDEMVALIIKGKTKVKEIYFKYRDLKDEVV